MSVILPGSYDPITKGHLDIIRRAAEQYDEVYVVVFTNPKKQYMFSVEDRVRMLMIATDDLDNVMVSYSNGLVIEKNNETKDRYDLRVSTITEYVRICKTYEKVCVLELKGYFGKENLKRLVEAIKAEDYLESIIFIAFDWKNLTDLKAVYPEATMQYLCREITLENLAEVVKNGFNSHCSSTKRNYGQEKGGRRYRKNS